MATLNDIVGDLGEYIIGDETIAQELWREWLLIQLRGEPEGGTGNQNNAAQQNNNDDKQATQQQSTISLTTLLLIGGFTLVVILGAVWIIKK